MRSLDGGPEMEIEFPPRKLRKFRDISECTNPNFYYRPKASNFQSIDSLVLRVGYFQMTVSMRHDIKEGIKGIDNTMNIGIIYFVVPHTHFKEFKKQKNLGDIEDENPTSSMDVSEEVSGVNKENEAQLKNIKNEKNSKRKLIQYVINLPLDTDMIGHVELFDRLMPVEQQDGGDVEKMTEGKARSIAQKMKLPSSTSRQRDTRPKSKRRRLTKRE